MAPQGELLVHGGVFASHQQGDGFRRAAESAPLQLVRESVAVQHLNKIQINPIVLVRLRAAKLLTPRVERIQASNKDIFDFFETAFDS